MLKAGNAGGAEDQVGQYAGPPDAAVRDRRVEGENSVLEDAV